MRTLLINLIALPVFMLIVIAGAVLFVFLVIVHVCSHPWRHRCLPVILALSLCGCAWIVKGAKYEATKIVKREIAVMEGRLEERVIQILLAQVGEFTRTWGAGGALATLLAGLVGKKALAKNGKPKEKA